MAISTIVQSLFRPVCIHALPWCLSSMFPYVAIIILLLFVICVIVWGYILTSVWICMHAPVIPVPADIFLPLYIQCKHTRT